MIPARERKDSNVTFRIPQPAGRENYSVHEIIKDFEKKLDLLKTNLMLNPSVSTELVMRVISISNSYHEKGRSRSPDYRPEKEALVTIVSFDEERKSARKKIVLENII